MTFKNPKKISFSPLWLIHWVPWAVLGLVALVSYLGINPFVHRLVIVGGAVPEKHGLKVEVFDRLQPRGKPSQSFFNSSEKLTLEKPNSSLKAYGLWKAPQRGNYHLRLDCDDYADLTIDGKNLIHLTGINAHNIGEAETFLEKGYHILVLRLFNGPGKGWATLQIMDPQKSFSLLAGDSVSYLERSNVETWLQAVSVVRQVSLVLLVLCLIVLTIMGLISSGRRLKEIHSHSRISRRSKRIFYAVIVFSFLIRWVLILKGGQYFFPDEVPFWTNSYDFLINFSKNQPLDSIIHYLESFAFLGYKFLCLPFIGVHLLGVKVLTGHCDFVPIWTTRQIPALLMTIFSVGNVVLIFLISRRSGANEEESLMAMILGAISVSLTYYTRHYLPYDLSMFFILFSVWMSLRDSLSYKNSIFCGIFICLAFLVYNGYWLSCFITTLLHIFYGKTPFVNRLKKTMAITAGLFIILLSLNFVYSFLLGTSFIEKSLRFASTIKQGEFSEGWLLPWLYFWDAEHGIFLLWILGGLLSIFFSIKTKNPPLTRIVFWLLIIGGLYLGLTLGSTFLEKFVVYGRLARQMSPFFCLFAAPGLYVFLNKYSKKVHIFIFVILLFQAGYNFYKPFQISYPIETRERVVKMIGQENITYAWTMRSAFGANELKLNENARFILTNATHFYPIEGFLPQPKGEVLVTLRHPLSYLPYQYEGYPPYQRERLRTHPVSIQLIDTQKKL